jgi:hypothetical protein
MDKELEQKLYDDYPVVFSDRDKSPMETQMHYGCQCGNGWFGIISQFCEELIDSDYDVPFSCVKEKMGFLEIYGNFKNSPHHCKPFYKIFEKYRNMSLETCEQCGSQNNVTRSSAGGFYIQCLCEEHMEDKTNGGRKCELKSTITYTDSP